MINKVFYYYFRTKLKYKWCCLNYPLKGMFGQGWKSEKIRNKMRMKKWENKKVFGFPRLCLIKMVEKWRDEKLFGLVENKGGVWWVFPNNNF